MPKRILLYLSLFLKALRDNYLKLSLYSAESYEVMAEPWWVQASFRREANLHQQIDAISGQKLDAHGHYYVPVAILIVRQRHQLTGRLLVFQLHTNRPVGSCGEKIQQILAVKADRNRIATIFFFYILSCLAILRT